MSVHTSQRSLQGLLLEKSSRTRKMETSLKIMLASAYCKPKLCKNEC